MANTLRWRQIWLPFFSDNQDSTSLIHDTTGYPIKYLFFCTLLYKKPLAIILQMKCSNPFVFLYENCYISIINTHWGHGKLFVICRWNFQINLCFCDSFSTLIIYSPWCRNKMAIIYFQKILCKFIFRVWILLYFFIKLTLTLKQNWDHFVFLMKFTLRPKQKWPSFHTCHFQSHFLIGKLLYFVYINSHWGWNKVAIILQMTISNRLFLYGCCCILIKKKSLWDW